MWRGVRQQLVRLGSVVDLTSPVAATLQQLPNATTASPLTAAIAYVPVATKKTDASRIGKPRYDPAEYKQMMIDYRQRLKKWRKELLAEVGAAQAEAERLRKEKLEAQRAFTAQCYQQRQERKAANRAQFERDHAEYMVAKTMYDTQVTEYRRAKADLYARMHMQKKAWLFAHSQHWITDANLDSRIQEALDNPVALWNIPWIKEQGGGRSIGGGTGGGGGLGESSGSGFGGGYGGSDRFGGYGSGGVSGRR